MSNSAEYVFLNISDWSNSVAVSRSLMISFFETFSTRSFSWALVSALWTR